MSLEGLRPHWRTVLGAAVGATAGAAYSYFIGCKTGSCAITANPWVAGLFFGISGAVVGAPGPKREEAPGSGRAGEGAGGEAGPA